MATSTWQCEQTRVATFPQAVPLALAENSGLPPIESLTAVKKRQLEEKNPYLGIDCNDTGERSIRQLVWIHGRKRSARPGVPGFA